MVAQGGGTSGVFDILVPAEHWTIGREHWVIPVGPTAALLPYARSEYLFNVRLGYSYHFDWRDIDERLCATRIDESMAFLDAHNVRWLLLRSDKDRTAEEAGPHVTLCGRPVEQWVEGPASVRQGRLLLYRLRSAPDEATHLTLGSATPRS